MALAIAAESAGDGMGESRRALQLLSDPFLLWPTADAVRVVWFTAFEGVGHWLDYGPDLERRAIAVSRRIEQLREDHESRLPPQVTPPEELPPEQRVWQRPVWRHEAIAADLKPGERLPYRVGSDRGDGVARSDVFSLAPAPKAGDALKILLTSDHQLMPLTAANLEMVERTVGRVDGVFHGGDLVNVPDRASEWFDEGRGSGFFPCLQGRAARSITRDDAERTYRGGELIQHAPLFPTVGNHEVMGRLGNPAGLKFEFYDPIPRSAAARLYGGPPAELTDPMAIARWWQGRSFNINTYSDLFLKTGDGQAAIAPTTEAGEPTGYYAVTFGDVRLVVLYATCVWRPPTLDRNEPGRYGEPADALGDPERWGWGQHIFEPIAAGSPQHDWLVAELGSEEFRAAKYKIVMLHHPPHTLGDNIVPPYTDPIQQIDRGGQGKIQAIRYHYPRDRDYLMTTLVPLLSAAGVQLVYYGHSHLWNRFEQPRDRGVIHFLESSNVGNTYGAAWDLISRPVPPDDPENYVAQGDPNGLRPVVPTIAPLQDPQTGKPLPYLASNDLAAFSIFESDRGAVRSYYYDARNPDGGVVLFDEFFLDTPDPSA
ncbi:MAG: metallophosphoesterase [Cyanophyceae cyanobacterium]